MTWTLTTFTTMAYLESDHDGGGEVEFPGGGNDALGDNVTPHDAPENVDHNGIDLKDHLFIILQKQ